MSKSILGVLAALLIPACGGDGSSATLNTAALQGTVYELDGQTVDRSGVQVRVVETGERAVTDLDGNFTFDRLVPGSYTLDFDTTQAPGARPALAALALEEGTLGEEEPAPEEGEAGGEPEGGGGVEGEPEEREVEDGEGRPRVEVGEGCGGIRVRVALENGEVKEFHLDEHETLHAKARLHGLEESPLFVEGGILVSSGPDGERFRIAVGPIDPGTAIEIFLDDRSDAGAVSVGIAFAAEVEEVAYERDTARGGDLPLGVQSVADLAGFRVEVRLAATGELLLIGEVPELGFAEGHPCGDDEAPEPEGDLPETGSEKEEPSGEPEEPQEPGGEEGDGPESGGEEPL